MQTLKGLRALSAGNSWAQDAWPNLQSGAPWGGAWWPRKARVRSSQKQAQSMALLVRSEGRTKRHVLIGTFFGSL